MQPIVRKLPFAAAVAIVPTIAAFVVVSTNTAAAVFLLVGGAAVFMRRPNAKLLAGGIVAGFAAIALTVHFLPDLFYKPFERYTLGERFPPGLDVVERVPFGDLVAMGGSPFRDAAEPHEVRLKTDGIGQRNARDFRPGDIVLVGDSFVLGIGATHEDTLAVKLAAASGRNFYAIGHPGGLADYLAWAREFGRPAWIFMFEGNDFWDTDCQRAPLRKERDLVRRFRESVPLLAKLERYRIHVLRAARKAMRGERAPPPPVERGTVAGKPILFFKNYVETARRPTAAFPPCYPPFVKSNAQWIKGFVFIPTKYRVYRDLLDRREQGPLPHAQWRALEALARQLGVPAFDLTPALQAAAKAELARGRLIFWRDDTHWNGGGAEAAARALLPLLLAPAPAE